MSCRDCIYFQEQPRDDGETYIGFCCYAPPPIVSWLYQLLDAEVATEINYDKVLNRENVKVAADYHCSEYDIGGGPS